MMRLLKIVVLLACHADAVKVRTGNADMLASMVTMLGDMKTKATGELADFNKQCAGDITLIQQEVDSLRMSLSYLIGADKVPMTAEPSENAALHAHCVALGSAAEDCGGEWDAHNEKRIGCQTEHDLQSNKANAAMVALLLHKYNIPADSNNLAAAEHKCPDNGTPPAGDISACATEWRIDFKEDQQADVARQCQRTNAIMATAINIYSSKGLGASFIQLAQEENVRADAKAFLETHSKTERNAELLKLLHDFLLQLKRDCHQDISDLKADINALKLHLKSKNNSAASEKRAHELAKGRQHEAQKCVDASTGKRNSVLRSAQNAYNTIYVKCPSAGAGNKCVASDPGTYDADFTCDWNNVDDRTDYGNGGTCNGSLMAMKAMCQDRQIDMGNYIGQLGSSIETIQMVINQGSFIQQPGNSFIQLESEQDAEGSPGAPPNTVLVQADAVNFADLVAAISAAMAKEIQKAHEDTTEVNAFSSQCANQLKELADQEGDPTICMLNGVDCNPATDGKPCSVCHQGRQCYDHQETAIEKANLERTAANAELNAKSNLETAKQNYLAAMTLHNKRVSDHAAKETSYNQNTQAMTTAISQVGAGCDFETAGAQNPESCAQIEPIVNTLTTAQGDMVADWTEYDDDHQMILSTWNGEADQGAGAEKYHTRLIDTNCGSSGSESASYHCQMVSLQNEKIGYMTDKAVAENNFFQACKKQTSTLNELKRDLAATRMMCKVGVAGDQKEELEKMTEALQILQQVKTKLSK